MRRIRSGSIWQQSWPDQERTQFQNKLVRLQRNESFKDFQPLARRIGITFRSLFQNKIRNKNLKVLATIAPLFLRDELLFGNIRITTRPSQVAGNRRFQIQASLGHSTSIPDTPLQRRSIEFDVEVIEHISADDSHSVL